MDGSRKSKTTSSGYQKQKERAAARGAAQSLAGRDIGPLPEVADWDRRNRAAGSFRVFCETYFPLVFQLGWSGDHLTAIAKIEAAVRKGGLFALAMPRGSGKTSLTISACLWAMLYGYRQFLCLIGSDEGAACELLDAIKIELETNDRLLADFPAVCYPIRRLEGIANRCRGQLLNGERTRIAWTQKEIVLPTVPGTESSGVVIRVAGITGRIRGMTHKRPSGETIRPSLVVIDDPQTDESARSVSQCATREATLAGAVLGLAGPGVKISGIMPCTVIREGDMADVILNNEKHPEWNGERTRMLRGMPTNRGLWDEYAKIRADELRAGRGLEKATEFYRRHRAEMDAGAEASWAERYNPDEASAIQHAMNLLLTDEWAFWAEYQNEPKNRELIEGELTDAQIRAKTNSIPRGIVPRDATTLTAFIDVQGNSLWWVVVAWRDDFSGWVVDYSLFPEQKERYFDVPSLKRTLLHEFPTAGLEASIHAGLEKVGDLLLGREWQREGGTTQRMARAFVDASWGELTDTVYNFCARSKYANILLPSHGMFVGAGSRPFSDYQKKQGDRVGLNWRVPQKGVKRDQRHLLYDANFWKSFIYARFRVSLGDPGSLSLFGESSETHRMFSEHCTAEYRIPTEGRNRKVDEWQLRPGRSENHWWDALVGCAVGASMEGCVAAGMTEPPKKKRRLRLSELRARKAG